MALNASLKEYLRETIPALKEVTNCNDDLLDKMIAARVFNSIDKEEIVS